MKKILATALILLASCALEVKPTPDVQQTLNQHAAVINAFATYIADLQAKGILPKPEPAKQFYRRQDYE